MKCLKVNVDDSRQTITDIEGATEERWDTVCKRFDDDVRRVMTVSDREGFTALYVCFDEDNQPAYYLVEEDEALARLKHRRFLSKLGKR